MPDRPDELERMLERGIASYSETEPLAGMEERIIARIGVTKMPRRTVMSGRVTWALALAMMAVAGLMLIRTRRSEPRPMAVAAVSRPSHFEPAQVQVRISETARQPHSARAGRVRALPKGPVFPTPSPLTTEERLMMALVSKNPDEAAQAFASLERRKDEPIAADPIVISPIPTSDE